MKSISERIDEHTHIPKEKLVLKPPFPKSIKIEITARCNYNCSYCATRKSLRPVGDMDKKFLYRILKELKEIGIKEVGLFLLGEPFLVDELSNYIRYAKKSIGIDYVFITTNGSLCTPKRLIPCVNAGLDSLKFSMNAGTKERYAKMHGVDAFDKVINNIRLLHSYKKISNLDKPRVCVSSIFMKSYKKELENLRKIISPYIDEFYYLPLYSQAGHFPIGKGCVPGNPGRLENMARPFPCWMLFTSTAITWNGKLTACCFDHSQEFEIADLNKVNLMESWHHPKIVELRRQHLEKDFKNSLCRKCLGIK